MWLIWIWGREIKRWQTKPVSIEACDIAWLDGPHPLYATVGSLEKWILIQFINCYVLISVKWWTCTILRSIRDVPLINLWYTSRIWCVIWRHWSSQAETPPPFSETVWRHLYDVIPLSSEIMYVYSSRWKRVCSRKNKR